MGAARPAAGSGDRQPEWRGLHPCLSIVGKRFGKSPKVRVCDIGPLCAMLGLVIQHRGRKVGVEIKFSSAPEPAWGFWQSLHDLQIDATWVVAPAARRDPLAPDIDVLPFHELQPALAALGESS
jgi:hypothetical protein